MRYPNFLKNDDTIGITALSSGCSDSVNEMNLAINNLKKSGFNVIVTNNVFGNYIVSSDKDIRLSELKSLLDEDIKLLQIARGGNFLYELLEDIPYGDIVNKNILVQGYSDPTSLLYILTTKYDLATIYGLNGKSYSDSDKYIDNNISILKGELITQKSYDKDSVSINGDFVSDGIIIGGCLEVLKDLVGTKFDNTINFIEKYKDKKIIWYFDIYAMKPEEVYLTLLQLKNASWFKYSDTFLIGKVLIKGDEELITYHNAYKRALFGNIVYDVNIGHVKPVFTIINGAKAIIEYRDKILMFKQQINK